MRTLLLTFAVLLLAPVAQSGDGPQRGYVPFCEIVRHPEMYDQQKVVTAGVIESTLEYSFFLDPACPAAANDDDSTLPVLENKDESSAARKRLDDLFETKKRAFVVVEARFDAFNRYKGELPKDERLQELLKKGNARFGPNNCCRFRLAIQFVKLAEPVAQPQAEGESRSNAAHESLHANGLQGRRR